jgi:putative inorganic carbon (HCO3(-)) transporter
LTEKLTRLHSWRGPGPQTVVLILATVSGFLLITSAPFDAGALAGLTVLGLATLVEPWVGMGAALFLGPLRAYLSAEVPVVPPQLAQPLLALALLVWIARQLEQRNVRIPHIPLMLPQVLFLGVALLSLWDKAVVPTGALTELVKWGQMLLVFVFVSTTTSRQRLPWLLALLLVPGLFQAGVGVWQFGIRGDGPDHFAILQDRFYRAYGTFEQPNPYAGYVGLILSVTIGLVLGTCMEALARLRSTREATTEAEPKHGVGLWVVAGFTAALSALLLAVALGMSWSRGAWLGTGASLLVMLAAVPRRRAVGLFVLGAVALMATGLILSSLVPNSIILSRLTDFADYVRFEDVRGTAINDANYAVIERLAHWQSAIAMLRHRPWTGIGLGCYELAYPAFALVNWPNALGHAHNYYLNVAAETGLLGLVAFLALWCSVIHQTVDAISRSEGLARGLSIGLLGAWTHLAVHQFLDNLYVNNVHLHIAVLLGLLAFLSTGAEPERRQPRLAD